ncbi:hypothetical protein H6G81_34305 [Scytonema hofmannii FACHB-248]|uniref:Uncharacterized protein n=1 Tax=Scytonema hofmannii FACHB-248 TaxID=1842502 RepID=A0ABR8H1V5_9CYAN|nr:MULTISPECIES: hypothetical protein [Nostocales]MBD2609428.1 hypothetical protein [Scytonema hofmannii FACHB-248]
MENQELKKAPEITIDASEKGREAEVKSDASSDQNVEVENKETKKALETTAQSDVSDRSPGKDRGL